MQNGRLPPERWEGSLPLVLFDIIFQHLRDLSAGSLPLGGQLSAAKAVDNAGFHGPAHGLLCVAADLFGIRETGQSAAGGRGTGIPPEHGYQLLTGDVLLRAAAVTDAVGNGPFHALFVPGGAARGVRAVKAGQDKHQHSAGHGRLGGKGVL